MPLAVIDYPNIDPVLVEFGPFAIRWYALAYVAGLLLGWRYARALAERSPWRMTREMMGPRRMMKTEWRFTAARPALSWR